MTRAFQLLAATPGLLNPSIVLAAHRAGATGILDFEFLADAAAAREAIRLVDDKGVSFGIKLPREAGYLLASLDAKLPKGLTIVILTAMRGEALHDSIRGLREKKVTVLVEATCIAEARAGEALGVDGLIAKGHEAGGRVADETSFILLQRFLQEFSLPVWVHGGIGLHTAAACVVAGAAGLILEAQLALTRESPLPEKIKAKIASMDGSETVYLGEQLGEAYRLYSRPGNPAVKALQEVETRLAVDDRPQDEILEDWRKAVAARAGWQSDEDALMLGQDAAFAAALGKRFLTVGGVLQAIRTAVADACGDAEKLRPLAPGSSLARSNGTRYPILQGPMTRVSDVPEFAARVAEGGALPFLALALMRGPEVKTLLQEARSLMGDKPWGVGILGFVPVELRQEQMEMIREARPPFALIAGGRPDQARALDEQGTPTYLHVPSPGLLQMFVGQGARRFVFEGRECGGHVGPRTSFVLWNQMIDVLLAAPELETRPEEFHVVFAGGIHDALSSVMISAMAAPLAKRGVCVGVLIGTAYLFTEEAVSAGAIQQAFQDQAGLCQETVLLETGPGHASRCVATPFATHFLQEKRRLLKAGVPAEEIRTTLEELNLGRLRIASKGVTRHAAYGKDPAAPRLLAIEESEQISQGMYMIGQVANLRSDVCTIEQLHQDVSVAGSARLEGMADRLAAQAPAPRSQTPSDIAVIGMSCHLPKAPDLQTFWENILGKVNAVGEVPEERWSSELYFDADPKAKDKIYSRWGGFLDDLRFEPMQYGMPPSTLRSIEPAQLLTLEVVRAALKDSGYLDRAFPRERTSVIFGAGGGAADLGLSYGARSFVPILENLPEFQGRSAEILESLGTHLPEWTEDSFAGILTNVSAGRVANRFDLGGSNYTVDAACASSLAAVSLAIKELEGHTSDMVIVGGIDTMQNPFTYLCFSKTQALSPRGRCRTFDESADGIALSEGIAMMVFKRLEDAERDGDRIYAVIKSAASSSDGRDRGLTAPRPEGQARALNRAYAKAGFSPSTVGLIEAHGTGTAAGDGAEVQALTKVFTEAQAVRQSCAIGSVKSMVGHTKCAAGAVGLMKAVLALHHKVLPPTLGVENPNPRARFNESPFFVNTEPRAWLDGLAEHPRRAGVSAFGFGGTNFHVVVEEYTGDAMSASATSLQLWSHELFLWSGASREALIQELDQWSRALANGTNAALRDLAFTAWKQSEERAAAAKGPLLRLAIVTVSVDDLRKKLTSALESLRADQGPIDSRGIHFADQPMAAQGKLALLFPGQGSQYPHMLQDLLLHFPEMGQVFESAVRVLGERLEHPLSTYIFPPPSFTKEETEARQQALTQTRIAQPALGAANIAMFRLLSELGVRADMMAGHSYGEYVALAAAGAFSTEDLISISEARGRHIVEGAGDEPGIMAAVDAGRTSTATAIDGIEGVCVANANAPRQTVISGTRPAVEQAVAHLKSLGTASRLIPVACAFHSPLVTPAQDPLRLSLGNMKISSFTTPVYSNTTARPYPTEPLAVVERLVDHLVKPVNFTGEIEAMYADGARVFVEVGPRGVLTGLVDNILAKRPKLTVASNQSGRPALMQLLQMLGQLATNGVPLNLERVFRGRANRRLNLETLEHENREPAPTASTWLVNGARAKPFAETSARTIRAASPKAAAPMPLRKPVEASPVIAIAAPATPPAPPKLQPVPETTAPQAPMMHAAAMAPASGQPQLLMSLPPSQDGVPEVMAQFQHMMSRFLDTQKSVMTAYLGTGWDGAVESASSAVTYLSTSAAAPVATMTVVKLPYVPESHAAQPPVAAAEPVAREAAARVPAAKAAEPRPANVAARVEQPSSPGVEEVTSRLLAIVSERTGYPPEMLSIDLDLEADLGIDSIKRVEILGTFQQSFTSAGITFGEGMMEKLAGARTLGAIVKGVTEQLQVPPAQKIGATAETAVEPSPLLIETVVAAASRQELTARLLQIVSERTGYPAEMLEMHLDLEADLGIDSIKRVEILGTFQQSFAVAGSAAGEGLMEKLAGVRTLEGIVKIVAEQLPANVPADPVSVAAKPFEGGVPQAPAPVARLGREALKTSLLQIVSERTGYPPDMLNLDLDLEADLGIDSIKRVEILGNFQQSLTSSGLIPEEGLMEQLARIHTLRGVLDEISKLTEAQPSAASAPVLPALKAVISNDPLKAASSTQSSPLLAETGKQSRIARYTLTPVQTPLESSSRKPAKVGTILVTEGRNGIGQGLADALRAHGHSVALVRQGRDLEELEDGRYAADFTSPEAVAAVLQLVRQHQGSLAGIVHLLPLADSTPFAAIDLDGWKGRLGLGTEALFHLAKLAGKELRELGKENGAFLLAATAMGGTFMTGHQMPVSGHFPDHGGVVGLTKTLALEWPEVGVKALDLNLDEGEQAIVAHLFDELTLGDDSTEVGYSGSRYTLELIPSPLPAEAALPLALDATSVVLITGGARGITAQVAQRLAERYNPTLVLLGRSPLPQADESAETRGLLAAFEVKAALMDGMRKRGEPVTPGLVEQAYASLKAEREIRASLAALQQSGAQVHYYAVDVRDERAFAQLIDTVYSTFGRIDGVIHAAGVIEDRLIQDKTFESFERVLDTKVDSAFVLSRKLRPESLKFLAFFSSVAGRFGNRGQGDYAAANEILNKLAASLDRSWPGRVVAINWGPWESSGMVSPELRKQFAERGVELIPAETGLTMLEQELSLGRKGEAEVVIGGAGWQAPKPRQAAVQEQPLFGPAATFRTNGHLEVLREFDTARDQYLLDHRLDGQPVVPLAVMTELIAETVAHEWPQMQVSAVRDLRVLQGVVLDNGPRAVRVVTKTLPGATADAASVGVEIFSTTQVNRMHYRASVELARGIQPASALQAAPLVDGRSFAMSLPEVYQRWLFHGPLLQGIERIDSISPDGIQALLQTSMPDTLLVGAPHGSWLIDPLMFDSALQLLVVWSREHWDMTALPSGFKSFRRFADSTGLQIACELRIRPETGSRNIHADIFFRNAADGSLVAYLEDMQGACSDTLNRLAGGRTSVPLEVGS